MLSVSRFVFMKRFIKIVLIAIVILIGCFAVFAGYIWLSIPDVAYLKKENPTTTSLMDFRKAEAEAAGKKYAVKQQWQPYQQIPEIFVRTVTLSEDAGFWGHEGVDWEELEKALDESWKSGKPFRGASTITQQTAKNLFLTPERSYVRKIREYFIAKKLEENLSKSRIIEIYLNVIEFGDGVFGVEKASQKYFRKSISELTLDEMVRLVAIIPNPLRMNPTQSGRELRWRSRVILNRLRAYDDITEEEYLFNKDTLNTFFGGGF